MTDRRETAILVSSRRQLLGALGTGATFVGVAGAAHASASEACGRLAVPEKVIQKLEQVLRKIWSGEALPVRVSRDQLSDTALQRIHGHLQNLLSDEAYIEVLQRQIDAEILAGDLVLAGDWLLSPTERDVCGMILILRRDAPETGMM